MPDNGVEAEEFELNPRNRNENRLADAAGRIAVLLEEHRGDPYTTRVLDDLLGAVYALIFSHRTGFTTRGGVPEDDKVLARARDVAGRKVRPGGNWIGGFHLNSALMRISGVYERAMKIVIGKQDDAELKFDHLRKEASDQYAKWTRTNWVRQALDAVHLECNPLKHAPKGLHDRRKVAVWQAIESLDEILNLLEQWSKQKRDSRAVHALTP